MRRYVLLAITFIFFNTIIIAQNENDSIKVTPLDEVTIESYYDVNARNNKLKTKDGQARTERIINSIPGAGIISRGNFAQEPLIRGLSDGQIFVTINGMKIFGACTDRMDPTSSYIEPNNLKSIKLNNGPGFDAGGATIGGSFNFSLKEPMIGAEKKLETSLGVGYETNAAGRQFLGNMQYSGKKFAVYLNGIYRKANNYTPGGDVKDVVNQYGIWTKETGFTVDNKARILYSQFEKWNLGVNAVYQLNGQHSLHADYITDQGRNIGYPALTMDVGLADANIASVSHRFTPTSGHFSSLETKLYFNHIYHAMDDTKRPAEQLIMHMDMPGYSWTGGFYSKAAFQFEHHKLKAKVESYVNRWHAEMTMYANNADFTMFMMTIPDAQRNVTGFDVEDIIHFSDKVQAKAGLRAELNSSSIFTDKGLEQLTVIYDKNLARNHFLWNVFVQPTYQISPSVKLDVKLARAQRAATVKELYAVYLFNRVDGFEYIGNPGIKNETAINIDAGIAYRSKHLYSGIKGFGYFFNNYIAGMVENGLTATMGSNGVKRYQNISSARIMGGEWMISWQPVNQWNLSSVNVSQKGIDANKNAMPMISPFHTTNKVEWQPQQSWNLYAESVFAAAQNNASSFYGEGTTPSFHIVNAGIIKSISAKNHRMVLSITGNNLFNQYYYEHIDVIKLPRPGRNIILHGTIYF
ncbi:MAG: TonB-dependent receptor [Niabella sp.]